MKGPDFQIRSGGRDGVALAIDWAVAEGWNPGLHDADPFFAADPEGFLVGYLDGTPIGTISAVRYGEHFGFLGFYIVAPPYRAQGYGLQLWNAAMAHLDGRNVGLDGVVAQQANYRRSGFRLAYRNVRYEGRTTPETALPPGVVPLREVPFAQVASYDRPFFPDSRTPFLRAWLAQPENVTLGMLREGVLRGYGMIRPCRTGYKIGPLFADDPATARSLFEALCAAVIPEQPVFLDVPETNPDGSVLTQSMQVVFETARMYTGSFPDLPISRLYGVTSFELG